MDIMELGAIGELVGGVAVIASLLFVGIQVRSNTRTAAAASHNAWVADYNSLLMAVRGDPEWMQTFRKGIYDFASLSHNDQALVHTFLGAHMLNAQNVFHAERDGQFNPKTASEFLMFCSSMIKSPGIAYWWKHQRAFYIPEFVARLESGAGTKDLLALHEMLPWYALEEGEMGSTS